MTMFVCVLFILEMARQIVTEFDGFWFYGLKKKIGLSFSSVKNQRGWVALPTFLFFIQVTRNKGLSFFLKECILAHRRNNERSSFQNLSAFRAWMDVICD